MNDSSSLKLDGSETPVAGVRRGRVQTVLRPIIIGAVVVALIGGVALYLHSQRFPSTEDAYVQANIVQIAPQVSGVVSKVHVVNNQHVEPGAALFDIDAASFAIAVESAQASLDEAVEAVGADSAAVAAAAARVREAEAGLANARSEAKRGRTLLQSGSLSVSAMDLRQTALDQAEAGLSAALAELERAQQQYGHDGKENARLRAASAVLKKAQLDLSYTEIHAPSAGWVSNMTLYRGNMVTMGRPVFSFVENKSWWIDAHFKETDLARLKPGQSASIKTDMYPDITFKGRVESISAGSGAAFSLLPPENATGNWVKVTQRYTVRIRVLDRNDESHPLRVGASTKVVVDTRS